ncbi:MAG TPA: rhodanese-related sulfurtransferase [Lacibacter sp.]|nr:rhodanese-related sulfurtransferase [Lacibacter sp.]HMO89675.1 rhodanese-related sulfurtransferase [Lacibacter sp.]
MAQLHNRVSRRELKERIRKDPTPRTTISFYRYIPFPDPHRFRNELYQGFRDLGVLGRIYVAEEGINAQLNVPTERLDDFRTYLYSQPGLNGVRLNIAVEADNKSFFVLDVKVRSRIVADGITDSSFSMENKGRYVNAEEFNQLAADPNTLVIDMRNHYEYEVGHFRNAVEIPSDTFREQLPMAVDLLQDARDRNIILYCTGGIRCEKASAYMKHYGFKNVFHLEGGIINYTRQAREQGLENRFIGKNFVFDERMSERISHEVIARCHQCGAPCDTHVNCVNDACHLLFIQCDACKEKREGCCSDACQGYIHLPEAEQKERAKEFYRGPFNKARFRSRRGMLNDSPPATADKPVETH